MNPDSPPEIREMLEQWGLSLKKRWGQNFLINRGARERLVSLLAPSASDAVWEIGPGLGSMTELLLEKAGRVIAFEVDRGLCRYLAESLAGTPSFQLVQGDFLETWKETLAAGGRPDLVLGNLPYRSASLMLASLIEGELRPRRIVVTVQKELAARMGGSPGTKSYSSFSVLCQSCFNVTVRGDLQPGSFYPVPDVVSSIVEMTPRDGAPEGRMLQMVATLSRGLFSSRRKTIRNNLGSERLAALFDRADSLEMLARAGIDPAARAEELAPEAFVLLGRLLTGSSGP